MTGYPHDAPDTSRQNVEFGHEGPGSLRANGPRGHSGGWRPARLVLAGVVACFLGCGGDTGAERITSELWAGGTGESSFDNEFGWTIELSSASLHMGPVYFFAGEPLISRLLEWVNPIRVARAHPGHYVAGEAMGQALDQAVVDLVATPELVGLVDGVTGEWNSAQLTISPLEGVTVSARGRATKAGEEPVDFGATIGREAEVDGAPCGVVVTAAAGRLVLAVDPTVWFNRVDFAALDAPDADGVRWFAEDSIPYNALVRGVESTAAFSFTWIAE